MSEEAYNEDLPNDDSRRILRPRGRPPTLTPLQKKQSKKRANIKYRTSEHGRANINAYRRERYRNPRNTEAADLVSNMLTEA